LCYGFFARAAGEFGLGEVPLSSPPERAFFLARGAGGSCLYPPLLSPGLLLTCLLFSHFFPKTCPIIEIRRPRRQRCILPDRLALCRCPRLLTPVYSLPCVPSAELPLSLDLNRRFPLSACVMAPMARPHFVTSHPILPHLPHFMFRPYSGVEGTSIFPLSSP